MSKADNTTDNTIEEPRDRILNAARRLFACQCFEGPGMRNIAQEAGVNVAMINYYFGSKHNILETLIDEYFDNFSRILKESFSGDASAMGSPSAGGLSPAHSHTWDMRP